MTCVTKAGWTTAVSVLLLLVCDHPAAGQSLSDRLKALSPLVNRSWSGDMKSPDGSRTFKTDRRFEALWDGSVVRYTASIPEVGSYSEGHFYWDREARKIAVVIVNSGGVVQRGTVTVKDRVVTIQGKIVFPEQTFDYRNTFEMKADGTMVDRWFQNAGGEWRDGHVIEFAEQKAKR